MMGNGHGTEATMRWWWLVLPLAGCGGPWFGGQFGEEVTSGCEPVSSTPLGLDEAAPNGVEPGALLDLAVGTHEHLLTWLQLDATTDLTLTIEAGDAAAYVDYEWQSSGDDGSGTLMAPAIGCVDMVEIDIAVTLSTADGALDESFEATLTGDSNDLASFRWSLDDVEGSFDPWDHAPAGSDYDEMGASLSVELDASGAHGTIDGQGEGTVGDPNDPDSAVYAERVEIATFGATGEDDQ